MQETVRFVVAILVLTVSGTIFAQETTTYVRYEYNGNVSYGILEDETIHQLRGDIFTARQRTGNIAMLGEVKLLTPTAPGKVIAVGFNYRSHLNEADPAEYPGLFSKYPTSLIPHDTEISRQDCQERNEGRGSRVHFCGGTWQ